MQHPGETRGIKFRTYRNKLNNLIRKSKRDYFYNRFKETRNNIRETWRTINSIIGRNYKTKQQSSFKMNEEEITDPNIISNAFNNFFVNIGPQLASKIHHSGKDFFDYLNRPHETCMFFKPIVPEEILKIIGKFNQNKSPGYDDIGNMIIKRVASEISKPLSIIFNTSLTTGIVPENLKIAKVVPIFKKDDHRYSQIIDLFLFYLAFLKF